tara:strand:- start:1749 stop:2000 length:252 start_codon:yes stop_codon:yes gene_type:complete
MPQPNPGEHRVPAGQPTVDILRADALQVPLGEISRDVDLRFKNGDIITVLDYQQISGYPVDYIVSAGQESWCLVELKAQSRPD